MNWLLPNTVGTTTVATTATPSASEPDCPSSSSPAFSAVGAGANKDQTDSGRSSPSASSPWSAADAFSSFSTSGQRRSASTSTSALCFGAGGAGVRLWSSSKALARAPKIHGEEEDAQAAAAAENVAQKGFPVGRHLRRISRRLRKARADNKEKPAAPRRGAVDDTARERAEAVAWAIAHCKETLRRGTPRRRRQLPPPLSSLSLDLWLRDRQDEIIASADECGDALAPHAPCMRLPLSHIAPPVAAAPAAVATGTPPCQISVVASSRETETRGGFSELEFLETFDGDVELIDRHFITVQI